MTQQSDIGESTVLGRRTLVADMPPLAVAFRWIAGLAGFGLLGILASLTPPQINSRHFLIFAVAIIVAEIFLLVRVGPGSYFSISPAFLFAYLLVGGGLAAAALDATARLIVFYVQKLRRRSTQTPLYALFNIGQNVLSILAGTLAVRIVLGTATFSTPIRTNQIESLLIFAATYVLASTLLTSILVLSRSGFSDLRTHLWPRSTRWLLVSVATTLPFAIVLTVLARSLGYSSSSILVFLVLAGIALILRLNVDLRKGNDDLKAINRIGNLINATLELSSLFKIIARESRKVLAWDGFFIAIGEKESPEVQIVFMSGGGDEITQRSIPKGAGLTGKAIATGELIHYEQDERTEQIVEDDTLRGPKRPRSIVVAPMKFGERVIGALSVQSFQPDVYGPSQLRLLQTMANQAAIAVRNAQLFESEQKARTERDEFLSLVTHEIKNPLTSIRGYAELVELSAREAELSSAVEAVGVIKSEARRILRLTEDLLDASKMTAGHFSVIMEETDFPAIVREIVHRYSGTAKQPISLDVQEPIPTIHADPVRLTQVVENLISNAVKYSQSPDTKIDVDLSVDLTRVRLSVRDEGIGIAPEKLPLVFDRFYRVEEDGRQVKGTGLGLFITREIMRMHGGTITVQSELGKGTVFTIELPTERRTVLAEIATPC